MGTKGGLLKPEGEGPICAFTMGAKLLSLFPLYTYNGAFANCRRRLYFANKKGGSGGHISTSCNINVYSAVKRRGRKKETAVFQASGEVGEAGGGPRAAAMLTLFFFGMDVFEER